MDLAGNVELHLLIRLHPRTRAIVLAIPLTRNRVLIARPRGLLQIAKRGLLRRVANRRQDIGRQIQTLVALVELTLEHQVATVARRRKELREAISTAHFLLQGVPKKCGKCRFNFFQVIVV